MSSTITILSIPGVARRLASFLTTRELSRLVLTNRALLDAFEPFLWSKVWVRHETSKHFDGEQQEQLARRVGPWVRELKVYSFKDMAVWVAHCSHLVALQISQELAPSDQPAWDLVSQCIGANPSLRVLRINTTLTTDTTARLVGWIKAKSNGGGGGGGGNSSGSTKDSGGGGGSSVAVSPLLELELFMTELNSPLILAILDASPATLQRCVVYWDMDPTAPAELPKLDLSGKSYPGLREFSVHVYDPFASAQDERCFWRLEFPVWRQSPHLTRLRWPELSEPRKIQKMLDFFEARAVAAAAAASASASSSCRGRVEKGGGGGGGGTGGGAAAGKGGGKNDGNEEDDKVHALPLVELDFTFCGLKPKYIARIIAAHPPQSIRKLGFFRELDSAVARVIFENQCHSLEALYADRKILAKVKTQVGRVERDVVAFDQDEDGDDDGDEEEEAQVDEEGVEEDDEEDDDNHEWEEEEQEAWMMIDELKFLLDACPKLKLFPNVTSTHNALYWARWADLDESDDD